MSENTLENNNEMNSMDALMDEMGKVVETAAQRRDRNR